MNLALILFLILGLPLLFVMAFIVLHRASYKHPGFIIKKIGDDWTLIQDKFRVRSRTRDGQDVYVVEFRKHSKAKSLAPPHKHWTAFWKHKKKNPYEAYTMTAKEIAKARQRGAIFYEANENELKPAIVNDKGAITVLDQDNRAFVVREMQDKHEFMKAGQSKWVQVALVIGPIFIVGLVALIMWIIFQNQMTENIAAVCQQAGNAASNGGLVNTVRGVAG